jgi:hypothetical protein
MRGSPEGPDRLVRGGKRVRAFAARPGPQSFVSITSASKSPGAEAFLRVLVLFNPTGLIGLARKGRPFRP